MDLSHLPTSAFIDPTGTNRHEVEVLVFQWVQHLLDHLTQAATVLPTPEMFAGCAIPEQGLSEEALFSQLQKILEGSMNFAHPGTMGHMDSLPTLLSILGDWLATAINNNLLSVEMSPLASRLEQTLMNYFATLFGLGSTAGGLLVSGGTLANLQALAVARNVKFQSLQKGLVGLEKQPVLLISEVAHTSLQKAAMLLGLGTAAVIPVPCHSNSQMSVTALKECLLQTKAADQTPFLVVATAGTTTAGALDPIEDIYHVAKAHDLWLHVDAAYGGALILSDQYRSRLAGIEKADSITFNPQKWLYVAKTCAMVLFKQFDQLNTNFRISAPYMSTDDDLINLGEISVQGTRHADVLKLWLSLQHLGRRGYAQLIDQSYQLTDLLVQEIQVRPDLELASLPDMNVICFRGRPNHLHPEQWDQWNTALQAYLWKSEQIWLSLPWYRGHRWLRAVVLNPYLQPQQIQRLLTAIDQFTVNKG